MLRLLALTCLITTSLSAATAAIIDVNEKRQTIDGFGTCIVSWGKVARSDFYNDEMARVYVEEMGYNILRVNVAPWAYPKTEKVEDITYRNIDLSAKKNSRVPVFIEFAKKLKKLNPDVKIIGTVWSPPPWMKHNNEITGGKGKKKEPSIHGHSYVSPKNKKHGPSKNRMIEKYYPHFCKLIAEMCKLHKEHGVPFDAMSAGNEVQFSQDFESCVWTAKDFATITGMLGETLEKEGFGDLLIFGPETMTQHNHKNGNPIYIKELQKNKTAWKQLDCFATHGYVDGFAADMSADSSIEYWDLIKDFGKKYWMTEGGTGDHDWPKPLTGVASGIHTSLVHGNANAFVPWQVASGNGDKNGHALMAGTTMTKKTHAMRHYSYFIKHGAQRIHVAGDSKALRISAFKHPESGRLCSIIVNPSEKDEELNLEIKNDKIAEFKCYRTSADEDMKLVDTMKVTGNKLTITLKAQSMITLVADPK